MSDLDDAPGHGAQTQARLRRKPSKTRSGAPNGASETTMPLPRNMDSTKLGAISSSLDSIHIPPRTPRSGRSYANGGMGSGDEVEMSLLTEDERRRAAADGLDDHVSLKAKPALSTKDKRAMALLIVLCMCAFLVRKLETDVLQTSFKEFQYVAVKINVVAIFG